MMNEDFDKRLTNHIKAVFDDTDNTGADAGWLLLRKKYPAKNNRKPTAWFWWLAAALLVGGLGLGLWRVEKKGDDKSIKTIGKAHNDSGAEHNLPRRVNSKPTNESRLPVTLANKNIAVTPVKKDRSNGMVTASLPNGQKRNLKQSHKNTRDIIKRIRKKTTGFSKNENASLVSQTTQNDQEKASPVIGIDSTVLSNINTSALIDGVSKFLVNRASLQLHELAMDKLKAVKSDTSAQKTNLPNSKRVTFGVFASAFYSSAAGSDNEFNLGAGATADIRLISHLYLSTGLGIMRASLNYSTPPGSLSYSGSSSTYPVTLPPVPGFRNYAARMLALDIPVNLKYSFAKPYNFIAAGLSSDVYISEYYDWVYAYPPASLASADAHQVIQNHYSHADLFKTFNFSFGLGYPISNKSVLIFEPFLKAPLSGLGSQQLKYTLLGINLKLNFDK